MTAFRLPPGLPLPRRDGVFTTVLLVDGRAAHWEHHRARLERSCLALFGERLPDDLDAEVVRTAEADAVPRRLAVRVGPHPRTGLSVRREVTPAGAGPRTAASLATVAGRTGDWQHKWCDRTQLDAAQELVGPDRVPLFVGDDGQVLETSRANLVVTDGTTLTLVPASPGALPGVTQQVLREQAVRHGMAVQERGLTVEDLDGPLVATCSSIAGVVAVGAVDGRVLQPDRALLARLRALLDAGRAQRGLLGQGLR